MLQSIDEVKANYFSKIDLESLDENIDQRDVLYDKH